jgi:iron-sulfur cluster repair protein YtfE (RIC family)
MTSPTITPDMTVSEVAERFPEARAVLAREGIDLCCGGGKSVEFVARAHGLDLKALLDELQDSVKAR